MSFKPHWRVLVLGAFVAIFAPAAQAAAPDLAGVRLGPEPAYTRVVLDIKGHDAPFTYGLSEDGMTLTVTLAARAASPALPRHPAGLVRAVSSEAEKDATLVTISAAAPIAIVKSGTLAPNGKYPFHRIYFDLGASPVSAPVPAPAPVQMASEEPPHAAHHEVEHEDEHGHEAAEPEEEEAAFTIKVGGSFERSLSDYSNSGGPTVAVETGLFHEALEAELGTTPLIRDGQTTWKTGLILKKPIELTERVEFEIGAGPIWLHRPEGDLPTDSIGVEGVLELVVWPGRQKSVGFYLESGYSYDFGRGHEKAAGGGAGLLFPIP